MSAVRIHRFPTSKDDFAAAVKVEPQQKPANIGDDQVLIRMTKVAINRVDEYMVMGKFPPYQPPLPAVPGMEGAGIVEAVGAGVKNIKVGQKVVPMLSGSTFGGYGAWQSYVVVNEQLVLPVPSDLSDDVAAQAHIVPLTMLGLFSVLGLQRGQIVVQNAANSQVGRQVIQYAKHKGIKTINLVRRLDDTLAKELKSLGADHVLSTDQPHDQLIKQIMEATGGKGADGAMDSVGGDIMGVLVKTIAFGGQIVIFGTVVPTPWPVSHFDIMGRMVRIASYDSSSWFRRLPAEQQKSTLDELVQLLHSKTLTPTTQKTYPLSELAAALDDCIHSARGGKILVSMQ
ncbi:hypothetical protein RI367_003451 [Sorochytrium milnesiophthora]